MKVRFHPEAVSELNNAVDYYEEQETGLGIDFTNFSINKAVNYKKISLRFNLYANGQYYFYNCCYASQQEAGLLEIQDPCLNSLFYEIPLTPDFASSTE